MHPAFGLDIVQLPVPALKVHEARGRSRL
jgi:hypothetical protein